MDSLYLIQNVIEKGSLILFTQIFRHDKESDSDLLARAERLSKALDNTQSGFFEIFTYSECLQTGLI